MVLKPEQLKDLERLASQGAELPKDLNAPAQVWFLAMRTLYRQYHAGQITREQAKTEKAAIYDQYRSYSGVWEDTHRLIRIFSDRLKDTESHRLLFGQLRAKHASPEELLKAACEIARIATYDETITP